MPGAPVSPARGVAPTEQRVVALDGLRGLMTLAVVVSHYFSEVPNKIPGLNYGWIAVITFFVLSGFLVGRLMLEKMDRANFLVVFYVRRACRTVPLFGLWIALIAVALALVGQAPWAEIDPRFPLWSYLTFTQNFFMVGHGTMGTHWLAPTWTLTVEEHFYLAAPAIFFLTPRRYLLPALVTGALASVLFRAVAYHDPDIPRFASLVLLPGVADSLFCGLIAAVLWKTPGINWARYDLALRIAPAALMVLVFALIVVDARAQGLFDILGTTLVAIAAASFMLAIMRNAPEAQRLNSPTLRFFGTNSYSIYLSHLAVLGLIHGLIFGAKPDAATLPQMLASVLAIGVTLAVSWLVTRTVEEPITAYGRSWTWSTETRRRPADTVPAGAFPANSR